MNKLKHILERFIELLVDKLSLIFLMNRQLRKQLSAESMFESGVLSPAQYARHVRITRNTEDAREYLVQRIRKLRGMNSVDTVLAEQALEAISES